MTWIDQLEFDSRGLIPAVTQEVLTGEVLMLAYVNREALERTLETGRAHYWSRSRQQLWQKGESSGHVQEVHEVRADCDGDAVLYRVRQSGVACHTGAGSCFHRRVEEDALAPADRAGHVLTRIAAVVRERDEQRPPDSYTTYLFEKGLDKILKKLGEEATETVIAAKNADPQELRAETADLLYHLLVLLRASGVSPEEVWTELEARFGAPPRRTLASATAGVTTETNSQD